jgi:hypothetical protein
VQADAHCIFTSKPSSEAEAVVFPVYVTDPELPNRHPTQDATVIAGLPVKPLAVTSPVPDGPSDAPVPTAITAEVFVPPAREPKSPPPVPPVQAAPESTIEPSDPNFAQLPETPVPSLNCNLVPLEP